MIEDQKRCTGCLHAQHTGAECTAGVDHGPSHWHRCLCLARPGANLPCPPQMNCQGGPLGYSDIWHLQRGQSLWSLKGVVTPDVLTIPPTTEETP